MSASELPDGPSDGAGSAAEPLIGVVAVTAAGRIAAARLAAAWPGEVLLFDPPAGGSGGGAAALRDAFGRCAAVVSFLAVGATVRVLAPLLGDKRADPPVVCVDEALRHAVALLGGHHGGNELACRVAGVLGCEPVVTTASDAVGATALDGYGADLGFTVANPELLARVGAAVLSGEPVELVGAQGWPLPPLPPNVRSADASSAAGRPAPTARIEVSDLAADPPRDVPTLRYVPRSLVVGVGASRGATAEQVLATVDAALARAGVRPEAVHHLASAQAKADEPGLLAAARTRGWPLRFHPERELAAVPVPNPSAAVEAAVGTPSVAEAAARHAGPGRPPRELILAKTRGGGSPAMVTAAIARRRPRGRLALIGLGPGARDLLTPRAVAELRRASVVVGLDQYLDQVRDLLPPGVQVRATGLGSEQERASGALRAASEGAAVALVGSGDAGVYAMASPALDDELAAEVDVVGVPGVGAAVAAAALLGAPLGHDHAYVSLSDLHTPWPVIERRLRAAADGDFVVCLYNPRSRGRGWQLPAALAILAERRPPDTPVGLVRNASRPGERVRLATLAAVPVDEVDMLTVVLVGASQTRLVGGRMVTPRGYAWERRPDEPEPEPEPEPGQAAR